MNASHRRRPAETRYLCDPFVGVCCCFILFGLGGFLVWSATAQLAQGITASGVLISETRRYPVQHLEGGIVQKVTIREGDAVEAGTVAMIISDAASDARLSQARTEMLGLLALIDRTTAELEWTSSLAFTRLDAAASYQIDMTELKNLNRMLFADRRAALEGERALIRARIERLEAQKIVLEVRRTGKDREIAALAKEREIQERALGQQLGNVSRLNELLRLLAIAETQRAEIDEDERVIAQSVAEAGLELRQIDLRTRAELSGVRSDAVRDLAVVMREVEALEDRRARSRVVVPVDGVVIDLAYAAQGGVVAPRDRLFDVVPSTVQRQVEVRFSPGDRDDLTTGYEVNLRFGTLDPIDPPEVVGTLDTIAADATLDPQTNTYYYLATVAVSPEALAELDTFEITAGIPVEVFFDKGTSRTPLSYFIEPIAEMMRLGMRS